MAGEAMERDYLVDKTLVRFCCGQACGAGLFEVVLAVKSMPM